MTGPETVLVAGPPRAGVSGVVAELRRRMPSHRFVEAGETGAPQRPAVVVFVVSAVAPITRSDCVLADRVAASTDAVVAVLAKIDDHRDWTAVLEANRECLAGHAGRFGRVPWVGAAAAPRLGEPRMTNSSHSCGRSSTIPPGPHETPCAPWNPVSACFGVRETGWCNGGAARRRNAPPRCGRRSSRAG
ncbi:hypothetical protein [Mycolicibacterium vanbaalenii]|uniref:hypothetical protein n=1 Tax=Mycolicibacterium vanbaalenii TaxID=110539 RepID=UPI0021F30D3D|nr:hypothetical protein [Mycolicibacterium vanbaalenii]MCV7130033.1 hypothetical protein [Mycolicibacterium vanbaalenii PYR-1]